MFEEEVMRCLIKLNGKELVEWWLKTIKPPHECEISEWYDIVPSELKKKLLYYIRQWLDVWSPSISLECLSCKEKNIIETNSFSNLVLLLEKFPKVPQELKDKLVSYSRQWFDNNPGGYLYCLKCEEENKIEIYDSFLACLDKLPQLILDPNPTVIPMKDALSKRVLGTCTSRWVCPVCGEKS